MFRKLNRWLEASFTSEHFTFREIASMLFTLIMDSFCIMIINVLSSSMVSAVMEAMAGRLIPTGKLPGEIQTMLNELK